MITDVTWLIEGEHIWWTGSGRPRQTISEKDCLIHQQAQAPSTVSLSTIQTQVTPSIHATASAWMISRCLAEGNSVSQSPLCVLPFTASHHRLWLQWCLKSLDRYGLELFCLRTCAAHSLAEWVASHGRASNCLFQQHNVRPQQVFPRNLSARCYYIIIP